MSYEISRDTYYEYVGGKLIQWQVSYRISRDTYNDCVGDNLYFVKLVEISVMAEDSVNDVHIG